MVESRASTGPIRRGSVRQGYGIDEGLDLIAEPPRDLVADRLALQEIGRDAGSQIDRLADAEEYVTACQLAGPLDAVDLALPAVGRPRIRDSTSSSPRGRLPSRAG
jgi:hypothetical protein